MWHKLYYYRLICIPNLKCTQGITGPCNQFSLSPNFSGNEDLRKLEHGGGGVVENMPLPPANCHLRKTMPKSGQGWAGSDLEVQIPPLCHRTKKTTPRTVDTLSKTGKYWKAETHYNTWASVQGMDTHPSSINAVLLMSPVAGWGGLPTTGPHRLSRVYDSMPPCEKKYNLCWRKEAPRRTFPWTYWTALDLGAPGGGEGGGERLEE